MPDRLGLRDFRAIVRVLGGLSAANRQPFHVSAISKPNVLHPLPHDVVLARSFRSLGTGHLI